MTGKEKQQLTLAARPDFRAIADLFQDVLQRLFGLCLRRKVRH